MPDIIVSRHGSMWDVSINDSWMGEYKFSNYYMRMMEQSQDPELLAYFKERLERARFVVNCVEQRRRTITRIVETVLDLQEDYFEGRGPLKPMQQEDVANLLGIHVSTVSRAIKGKYVQYKKSVPLKSLFSTALPAAVPLSFAAGSEGENTGVSADQIKQKIRQMIEKEGKKPLSDQKITERLAEEGIQVSRRVVQKYRIQLNIPDSRQRGMLL